MVIVSSKNVSNFHTIHFRTSIDFFHGNINFERRLMVRNDIQITCELSRVKATEIFKEFLIKVDFQKSLKLYKIIRFLKNPFHLGQIYSLKYEALNKN